MKWEHPPHSQGRQKLTASNALSTYSLENFENIFYNKNGEQTFVAIGISWIFLLNFLC
jgi:hypothetical protein